MSKTNQPLPLNSNGSGNDDIVVRCRGQNHRWNQTQMDKALAALHLGESVLKASEFIMYGVHAFTL